MGGGGVVDGRGDGGASGLEGVVCGQWACDCGRSEI